MVCSLVSITYNSPELDKQLKRNIWNFRTLIQRYAQFWFFRKGPGKSLSTKFWVGFLKKNVSQVTLY